MDHAEYSPSKLSAHPNVISRLRAARADTRGPITVHLMPQNLCNQSCSFCSYRMPENKNSEVFDESTHIPIERMRELIGDLVVGGTQGVEVTGGGEPLAYPHFDEMWSLLLEHGLAVGLVSNGVLLSKHTGICTPNLSWVRISIDASKRDTYATMRGAHPTHFDRAWDAVRHMRRTAPERDDFRLGVGFVLSNENTGEVYDFVRMAKEAGADNVRLSVTYSDKHEGYFSDQQAVVESIAQAGQAEADFGDESFAVHNLMRDRWNEVNSPSQDYHRCPSQEVLCVIEGSGMVYTCCTFTGSSKGRQGVFWDHPDGFLGLWRDKLAWRSELDPRTYCQNSCLYEKRNRSMIDLIEGDGGAGPSPDLIHTEFI